MKKTKCYTIITEQNWRYSCVHKRHILLCLFSKHKLYKKMYYALRSAMKKYLPSSWFHLFLHIRYTWLFHVSIQKSKIRLGVHVETVTTITKWAFPSCKWQRLSKLPLWKSNWPPKLKAAPSDFKILLVLAHYRWTSREEVLSPNSRSPPEIHEYISSSTRCTGHGEQLFQSLTKEIAKIAQWKM